MSQRFYLPIPQIFTDLGVLAPGWKLYFYETGTTTPKAVYSDTGLSVQLPNPVLTNDEGHLIDGSGNITSIYFADASMYKAILKDENDVEQWTADPCDVNTTTLANLSPRPAYFAGITTGTSSAYVLEADPAFIQYSSSDVFELKFHTACAVSPTLQYAEDQAALNLKKYTGQGTKAALLAGDVQAERYWATNDGTDVVILNPRSPINYFGTATAITISGGVATLTNVSNSYIIDGEGAAADTLDTINGLADGQEVIIQIANSARPITFSLSGNLLFPTGESMIVNSTTEKLRFVYRASDSKAILIGTTRLYAPSGQTITANAQLVLAHGLGKTPDLVRVTLNCTSNDVGYTAGQVALYGPPSSPSSASFNRGLSMIIDATIITVRYGDDIELIRADNGVLGLIDKTKWTLGVRAYLIT